MKDWLYYLLAAFAALIQITLHAADMRWVIPNLCLVLIIWAIVRLSLGTLTFMALIMSAIMALGSAQPIGFMVLALYLVILSGRTLLQRGRDLYQLRVQIGLLWLATILINTLSAFILNSVSIFADWTTILFRSGLEGLYNMLILLVLVAVSSGRARDNTGYHRLPKIR